jgi:uncharacterized protein YqgC (DUF456 family)
MTTVEIVGLSVALLVMFVGLIGSIVPALPGPPLVLIAAIGHRLCFGDQSVSGLVLIILVLLTIGSIVMDHFTSMYGAKWFGATWRGIVGAALGGIVGMFFSLPGLIIGPFLGATVLELMGGYKFDKASRAGLGATVGLLAGIVGKCILCVGMIALFTVNVIVRS